MCRILSCNFYIKHLKLSMASCLSWAYSVLSLFKLCRKDCFKGQKLSSENRVDRDPFYGWVMVISVFTLTALSFGTMGSISVFLKPLSNEFGWTRANTAFGYTVASLGSAIFGIIWGYIADKYGTRLFGFFATFFMVSCLFLLGKQNSICLLYTSPSPRDQA